MTTERYHLVVELFETAAGLQGAAREQLLAERCKEDALLRQQVEELLAADESPSVLGQPMETLAAQLLPSAYPELSGRTLGHYRVLSKLGEGGMGVVYLAEDSHLGRKAALKLLPEEYAGDLEWNKRFQVEARTVSALNHPNIVTVYGLETADGVHVLASEYVDGPTLRQHETAFSVPAVIDIARQIASGLAAAHQAGVVHRDLKPENIIRRKDGLVKILDFGLAAADDAGLVKGTPAYMSPEQALGKESDARSDIFSLGAVMYELLSGRTAFRRDGVPETLEAVIHADPERLENVPANLRAVVDKALAKDPAQRHPSMEALLEDLKRVERGSRAAWKWAAAAAVLIAAAAGVWRWQQPPGIQSIAVLPLRNLSGADNQYMADGLTEQLITDLSKIQALRVVALPSVMRYAADQSDLPKAARELGVQFILTGSVVKAGLKARISAQLVGMPGERNLWAENYDRDVTEVLALQSQVAKAVASSVRVTLTPQEQSQLKGVAVTDPAVNELYLQGRFFANKTTEEGLRKGIDYFERAIIKDPTFANAYAGLAFAYSALANPYVAPADAMPQAKAAASKAIQLDPALAEAHALMGLVHLYYDWDWDSAEAELKQAVALNPSSSLAHLLYEDMLLAVGRLDEALAESTKSIEADPLSIRVLSEAQFANLIAGHNDRTIELGKKVTEIEPQAGIGHVFSGLAYAEKNELTQAVDELETAVRLEPTILAKGFLAHVRALNGDKEGAKKLLEQIKAENSKRYVCSFELALGYATLGDKDEAFRLLNEGVKNRADCMVWLRNEPWLRSINKDTRFGDLVKKVGFK